MLIFFFSSRRRHTRLQGDWSSDVCSSDLGPTARARLARARRSAERVQIITKAEAEANTGKRVPGTKTWRFTARNVRDFAWAASPDFRWDASSWNGILIQTFYRPGATPWEEANKMAWFTIKHFSETWGTYPWPHATTVEGLVEGMEYPMLTFVPSIEQREDQFWVLTHEFGHEWFPMLVGSDERRYPWMDRSEEHTSELQSPCNLVCRLLLEK